MENWSTEIIKRIVLIGYRGTGKTTVGIKLAELLGWDYFSTDFLVEQQAMMSITHLVENYGWQEFRIKEHEVAIALSESRDAVIDCGGGIIEDETNMKALLPASFVVWIDASITDISKRIAQNDRRPLLSASDILSDIQQNYKRRQPVYQKFSHFYINSSINTPEEICRVIIKNMEQ